MAIAPTPEEEADFRSLVGRQSQSYGDVDAVDGVEGSQLAELEQPESLPEKLMRWCNPAELPNIAEELDLQQMGVIGMQVIEEFEIDESSRSDWKEKAKKAMDMAMQITKQKSYPWENACYSLDTDLLTKDGWKPVGEVKVGDLVFSRAANGEAGYQPVTKTFRHTAAHVVHFEGKSIDLMVTPNHRMLVETDYPGAPDRKRYRRRKSTAFIEGTNFIEAQEFLKRDLQFHYIPTTSAWEGASPDKIYGIDAKAYVRFLGWYIAEGWAHYTPGTTSSFGIAQSESANPAKHAQLRADIEACGFTWAKNSKGFTIHARSMPELLKAELRALGRAGDKHIPSHVLTYGTALLAELLETLVAGDGHVKRQTGRIEHISYYSISYRLADQVQEIAQKLGMRATIAVREARAGGVINGRQISGARTGYAVSINRKPRIKVATIKRRLIPFGNDVACVEVQPHHTVYVRRNGKALWCGNSNVVYPLMTEASNQFASRAYSAIIPDSDVVKGKVYGDDEGVAVENPAQPGTMMVNPETGKPIYAIPPGAKAERAQRIAQYMSYQLLEEQPEWEADTDKMLHIMPIIGCFFRKSYFDPSLGRNMSCAVSGLQVTVNYFAKSIELAPRISEEIKLYPYEIEEHKRSGYYLNQDFGFPVDGGMDRQAPHTFIEQHRRLDLDGDGYEEPYIVIVHKDTYQVARITARFDPEGVVLDPEDNERVIRIEPVNYYTKYDFLPNKEGGIYGQGFAQLLLPLNEAVNTAINMLLDAGHLQNAPGGFVGTGLSIHSGTLRFKPGYYMPVKATGKDIREAIVPLQHGGPSPVLFQLLGLMIEASKDISALKDVITGEVKAQTMSPTVFLALVEQGMQVFSSIYKRIHRSLRDEFDKLYRLNRLYLEESKTYQRGDATQQISRADFVSGFGVEPVSDPKMVADAVRIAKAEFLTQFKDDPLFDGVEIRRRILEAAHIDKIDKLITGKPAPNPEAAAKVAELALKNRELALKAIETKARAILYMAQAVKNLADADAAVQEDFRQWQILNIQQMRNQIDAIAITGGGDGAVPGADGSEGIDADAMGGLAPSPGDQGVSRVPSSLPAEATA